MGDRVKMDLPFSIRLNLAWRALVGTVPTATTAEAQGFLVGVTQKEAPQRTSKQFLEAYSSMPHLRNVTHRIADSCASVKVGLVAVKSRGRFRRMPDLRQCPPDVRGKMLKELKQSGELVEIEDHPLIYGLRGRYNAVLTGYSLRFLMFIYNDILGENFWLKDRGGPASVPIAFYPLPPTWIQGTPSASDPTYYVSHAGYNASVPSSEITWFKDPDPVNPYGRGSGVARSLADELDIDEYAAKMTKSWFLNDAMPAAIVAPGDGQGAGPSQIAALKQAWMNEHQGFWRRFRIHFSTRKIDVHQLSHTFRDQQLPELRTQQRDFIVQTLNIPPEQVGILTNSNRATIEGSNYIYATNVVVPRMERFREQVQEWLIPEYEDPEKLFFVYESPVPEDKEHKLATLRANPHSVTRNEWRMMQGLEPRPDGDVYDLPIGIVSQPAASERVSQRAVSPPAVQPATVRSHFSLPVSHKDLFDTPADDDLYLLVHAVADRLMLGLQRRFREVMLAARENIDLDVLENALRQRLAQHAEDTIPWNDIRETFREAATTTFRQAVIATGEGAALELGTALGVEIGFNIASPRVATFAGSHAALLVTRVEEPTRQAIRQAIARVFEAQGDTARIAARQIRDVVGLLPRQESALEKFRLALAEQGRPAEEIARRVERLNAAMLRQRASMIARTELIDSANEGQFQLWQQAAEEGVLDTNRARRFWIITPDDRLDVNVCEPIPSLNPDGVALDQPFVTPSGPIMRPTAHPGCRCAVTLRFKD